MKLPARPLLSLGGYLAVASVMLRVAIAGPLAEVRSDQADRLAEAPVDLSDAGPLHTVDPAPSPYAAVGRFTGTVACTGAIVLHPRIMVTAGHCIARTDRAPRLPRLFFQPGYQAGTDLDRFAATVWAAGSLKQPGRQSVYDAANDWAILVLDRSPAGIRPLLLSHRTSDELSLLGRQLILPSYSSDVTGTQTLSIDPTCAVREMIWDVLVHDCKASLGSSGAPLLIQDGQWYAVVAIHSGSMLASEEGRAGRLIGNSAIGAWAFADAMRDLFRRLSRGDDVYGGSPHVY